MIEQRRIELPSPTAFDASQRLTRDVFDDVRVLARLFGNQAKSCERTVEVGIHTRRTRHLALAFGTPAPLRVLLRRAHREIHEDDSAEMFAVRGAGFEYDESAEAVTDDERPRAELRCFAHAPHFFGELRARVRFSPAAVAVAG